jgi:HK97 family phage portal protein
MLNWLGRILGGSPPREAPKAATQRGDGGIIITNSGQIADYLRGVANGSASGAIVTESTALKISTAYRCTSILACTTAGLPLDLYLRVDERRRKAAVGHKMRDVLTVRPNEWQTPYDFRKTMTANAVIHGNAAALKVKSLRYGLELWPLTGGTVVAKINDAGRLVYEQKTSKGTREYRADEIFFLRNLSMDGLNGMGVLQAAREALGNAIQGEKANAGIFKQGRIGNAALKTPNALSEAAFDRLRSEFDNLYTGADNAHRVPILEEGLDFAQGTFSADDLQFLESRAFTTSEIGRFFGVPPHMYGDTTNSTSWGTGIEEQKNGFVTFTLMDYVNMWNGAIARDLLTPDERATVYASHDLKGLLAGNATARGSFYQIMRNIRALSANEVRALEDLEPIEGGDTYENPSIDVTRNETNEPSPTPAS